MALQQLKLDHLFPDAHSRIHKSELTWKAPITPTALSDTYTVRMTYRLGHAPRVVVLEPELERPMGRSLPHIYTGDRLCLYLPKAKEWSGQQFLVDTIVPWTAEWLSFYEVWVATGKWLGGGTHPGRWDVTGEMEGEAKCSARAS